MATMRKNILVVCALLFATALCHAQTLNGKITDSDNEPIPNAVIILQNSDTAFVRATVSDTSGVYNLPIDIASGFVVVQHLVYESQTIAFANSNYNALKNIILTDKANQLDGVTVKAEAPAVTVKDNALVYNAQHIARKKAVSSAFELLKYTPGVTVHSDEIKLAGASQLTMIIDGKATMLSIEEIADMLKTMPASRIGNIEVMYKAPAKYGVRGALINITTDKKRRDTPLEAELSTEYTQQFYASGRARANVAYRGEKLDFDVLANTSYIKERIEKFDYSINDFNGVKTIIDQKSHYSPEDYTNTYRASIDYNFNDDNSLSLMYYLKDYKTDEEIVSTADFLYHTGKTNLVNSSNVESDKSRLHNVNLKGVFGGANITADYVTYNDKMKSNYKDFEKDSITTDYQNNSTMDIDQLKLLASYDWAFSENWIMSAGAQATMAKSATKVNYLYPQNGVYELDNSSLGDNLQKERRFSVFAETFNTVFDSIQIDFTLELEYFKSDYDENGAKSTLWDEWMLYPSLSVAWPLKRDMIQLSISTYKDYPTYWNLSPHASQMNPYKFFIGNPTLKPSTNYNVNLAYILKKQHTIEAYCIYAKDYMSEIPYQNAEELRNYYQTVNFDFGFCFGVGGEFPFHIGFWEPTLSGNLFYDREKMSDFHNTSFDRDIFMISVEANNTFTVSEKPDLKFTLDAAYISKGIQGIFDISSMYNLEIGMKWGILKNLIFTAKWSDIFEHWAPYPATVKFNGQYNKLDQSLFNKFNASLVWRIGGFKAKDVEITNTDRMQR